jgi:hypothetical protein
LILRTTHDLGRLSAERLGTDVGGRLLGGPLEGVDAARERLELPRRRGGKGSPEDQLIGEGGS